MTLYRWGRPDSLIIGSIIVLVIRKLSGYKFPPYFMAGIYSLIDIIGWYVLPSTWISLKGPLLGLAGFDVVLSYGFWLLMIWAVKIFEDWEFGLLMLVALILRKFIWHQPILLPFVLAIVFIYYAKTELNCE